MRRSGLNRRRLVMDHSFGILLNLLVVFIAAQIGGEIAQRLKFPAVVGEIAAGCLVSPFALNLIHLDGALESLSELGAVLLLFSVGLETRLEDIRKVGVPAFIVAALGVIAPFVLGGAWAYLCGYATPKAMFVAAAFVATSAGITARVLQELDVLGEVESQIILGAAVIDDILGMLLLGFVTSFQAHGSVDVLSLGLVLLQAVAFIGIIVFVGTRFVRAKSELFELPMNPLSPLTLSLTLCLALAALAAYIGLAAIIGAFLAGMLIAESSQRDSLGEQLKPLEAFLVPFFFVATGARVDLRQLAEPVVMETVLLVTALAIFSKLLGCGIGAARYGMRSALIIGVGMAPRGEVGIIVATLGLQAGVFSNQLYGIIIAMSLLTSVITPPVLKKLFGLKLLHTQTV